MRPLAGLTGMCPLVGLNVDNPRDVRYVRNHNSIQSEPRQV